MSLIAALRACFYLASFENLLRANRAKLNNHFKR